MSDNLEMLNFDALAIGERNVYTKYICIGAVLESLDDACKWHVYVRGTRWSPIKYYVSEINIRCASMKSNETNTFKEQPYELHGLTFHDFPVQITIKYSVPTQMPHTIFYMPLPLKFLTYEESKQVPVGTADEVNEKLFFVNPTPAMQMKLGINTMLRKSNA